MTCVVLARLRSGVTVGVVPELAERPGAEDDTESWQGEVDVGVRVLLKTVFEGDLKLGDLAVQFADDGHGGSGRGCERLGQHRGGGQLLGAQCRLDLA